MGLIKKFSKVWSLSWFKRCFLKNNTAYIICLHYLFYININIDSGNTKIDMNQFLIPDNVLLSEERNEINTYTTNKAKVKLYSLF